MTELIQPPPKQFLRDDVVRGGMDLMFLAHRGHLQHADDELAKIGLGRAHHRALYFIARKPDLCVGELLDLLAVTKQSVGRVLKELTQQQLVKTVIGDRDRRQRMLRLTDVGAELEARLFADMRDNMAGAFTASGPEAVAGYWLIMQHLMGETGRRQFTALSCPDQ